MSARPRPGAGRPCLRDLGRLSAYVDKDLSPAVCQEIRRHMAHCSDCRILLRTLKKTITLCRQAPARQPSRATLTRVRSAIKRELSRARSRSS